MGGTPFYHPAITLGIFGIFHEINHPFGGTIHLFLGYPHDYGNHPKPPKTATWIGARHVNGPVTHLHGDVMDFMVKHLAAAS